MAELLGLTTHDNTAIDVHHVMSEMSTTFKQFRPGTDRMLQHSHTQANVITYHHHDDAFLENRSQPHRILAGVGTSFWSQESSDTVDSSNALKDTMIRQAAVSTPGFVACAMDAASKTTLLISDRFGLQPLYYVHSDKYLIFSTKLIPLLKSKVFSWRVHSHAVVDLLSFEHVTSHHTLVDQVMLLPPATVLTYHQGRLTLNQYCDPLSPSATASSNDKTSPQQFYHALGESVARATQSHDKVSITLSGGLDSRALLHYAIKQDKPVSTYSFGQPHCRDLELAAQLAAHAKVEHTKLFIDDTFLRDWLDHAIFVTGGMVGATHYHILSLANILQSSGGVVLDGLGGDAMTGGHLKWGMFTARQPSSAINAIYRQRVTAFSSLQHIQSVLNPDFMLADDYDAWTPIRQAFSQAPSNATWLACHAFDFMQRQRRFIQFGPHLVQPIVDVRTPFYDQAVLDSVFAMTPKQLCEQSLYLKVHAKFMRDLAVVPDSLRGIPLTWPQSLRFGKKVLDFAGRKINAKFRSRSANTQPSTTNYRQWFQHGMHAILSERLLETSGLWTDIINRQAVESMLHEHQTGQEDHTNRLGCLLALATWCEQVNQL